jgi:hypothetical protein
MRHLDGATERFGRWKKTGFNQKKSRTSFTEHKKKAKINELEKDFMLVCERQAIASF